MYSTHSYNTFYEIENPQKFLFYKYNFSSRMLVFEKRKKGKCMHTIVSIYSEIKLRRKKIFTSTISMWTFPYRFTPLNRQSTKKHGKQNIIKLPSIDKIYSFICFSFFKYMHIVFTISNLYLFMLQRFLREISLSRKRNRTSYRSRSIKTRKIFTYRGKQRDR